MNGTRPAGLPGATDGPSHVSPADLGLIDEFCDALWLEDGLSKNTLEAYRRDLRLFAQWQAARNSSLDATSGADLSAYLGALATLPTRSKGNSGSIVTRGIRASTQARIHSSFKRFFQYALRIGRVRIDPTLNLDTPKKPVRLPKTLGEADVEALVARALAEARKDRATRRWDGVVANGRLAWYGRASGVRSHKLSIEMSAVQHLAFPVQLSFRDADGGLAGFGASPAVGGQRVVARFEERKLLGTFGGRADFAVGLFATAGRLWAGDVPYGGTTPVRASAGISLLGAYPTGGKRTYRLDIAVPFNPERGGPRVEFRLSASDRTRLLWIEPGDVSRARTGAVPVSLMKW